MTRLSELRALEQAATKGPWRRIGQRLISKTATRTVADMRYVNGVNDANAVAEWRNAAPAILNALDALQRVHEWHGRMANDLPGAFDSLCICGRALATLESGA